MNKHQQAILDLIRRCGRRGDGEEARRLYLAHCVGFRQYRAAYETGRQEARKLQLGLDLGARR